uniref:Protein kinase domain-containing protein n=1 Tax=Rhabditophanes sp. KR3021 TaxID=114890 RepID=A0AC35TMB6_9BILA
MSSAGKIKRKTSIHSNIAGLYDLEKTIGKGHFAVVKLARHVFTGERVAIKIIDKTKLDPVSTNHIMQEVRCMKLVQHPNIVRLYEVIDTQTKLFLILELGDYDMFDYIMKNPEKGCNEKAAQHYFSQIIKAIDYCHALHVVHRDLKPENVVFFEKLGMAKLTDFGFSNLYIPGEQLKTSCGSLAYSAPEILLGDAYDAPKVDIWSLGVLLYMLLCGRLPFQETNESETLTKILDCKYTIPDNVSNDAKYLISRMLVRNPKERACLSEIIEHSWVIRGDKGHAEALPLIVREHLPDSAHNTIIEQMIIGGIGKEEEILNALEWDEYNYISATYYLLAERVLSSIREEQAARLLVDNNLLGSEQDEKESPTDSDNKPIMLTVRSRSNSFRGTRRQCSILKEESEEELSTYLRSSSRQSSRFYNPPSHQCDNRLGILSKKSSVDASSPPIVHSPLISPAGLALKSPLPLSVFSFSSEDHLSPITEQEPCQDGNYFCYRDSLQVPSAERALSSEHLIEEMDVVIYEILSEDSTTSSEANHYLETASARKAEKLARTASAPMTRPRYVPRPGSFNVPAVPPPKSRRRQLIRRNSSPSVSMLGLSGIASSKDRVSPQAIQELLELTRISSRMGRAASPDSRISSRSPSPPSLTSSFNSLMNTMHISGSGRASPSQMETFVNRIKNTSIPGSGMRKLSSSPHLLGICEESEEALDSNPNSLKAPYMFGHSFTGHGRNTRSSSMIGHTIGESAHLKKRAAEARNDRKCSLDSTNSGLNMYNSTKLTRQRAAIGLQDLNKRFESQHKIMISKTRRSMSCSSSETSEDDSQERKLSLLNQKYCQKKDDDFYDDEDPSCTGNGTKQIESSKCTPLNTVTNTTNNNTETKVVENGSSGTVRKHSTLERVTSLQPIDEMFFEFSEAVRKPSSSSMMFVRSQIAEKVICDLSKSNSTRSVLKVLRRTESLTNIFSQEDAQSASCSIESLHSFDSGCLSESEILNSDSKKSLTGLTTDNQIVHIY